MLEREGRESQSSRIPAMTTARSPLVVTADPIGADAPRPPRRRAAPRVNFPDIAPPPPGAPQANETLPGESS